MATLEMTDFEVMTDRGFAPGAPPKVPGLAFRLFRGESDYPGIVAAIHAAADADQLTRADTVEEMALNYSHLVNCDPYRDILIAEVDKQIVGYSRVAWRDDNDGYRLYILFGFLDPRWRRKGIGRAMLRHNERRLRDIAAGHETELSRQFESFAHTTEVEATALLRSEGYQPIRDSYEMRRPTLDNIPNLKLPDGLEVRPAKTEHYRLVWEATQEAFRDHWSFTPETEEDYQRWLEDPNFDPPLWRVAWDKETNQVAGMVLSFINSKENEQYQRLRGWTENICVRRPWRQRGLARYLIAQSLHAVKERGMTEAGLGVDAENRSGALNLYKGMGYEIVRQSSMFRKPMG